jgi:hypothetical protein
MPLTRRSKLPRRAASFILKKFLETGKAILDFKSTTLINLDRH